MRYLLSVLLFGYCVAGQAQSAYSGGVGNGGNSVVASNIALSLADSVFNGGIGMGTHVRKQNNTLLATVDSVFNGGIAAGNRSVSILNTPLAIIDSTYNGGTGYGTYFVRLTNTYLAVCGNELLWNGNSSISWHNPDNWSCGRVPTANDVVIIPANALRFPAIISNVTIKSLLIEKPAVLALLNGSTLTLTGN